jgi:hypothetical protein
MNCTIPRFPFHNIRLSPKPKLGWVCTLQWIFCVHNCVWVALYVTFCSWMEEHCCSPQIEKFQKYMFVWWSDSRNVRCHEQGFLCVVWANFQFWNNPCNSIVTIGSLISQEVMFFHFQSLENSTKLCLSCCVAYQLICFTMRSMSSSVSHSSDNSVKSFTSFTVAVMSCCPVNSFSSGFL